MSQFEFLAPQFTRTDGVISFTPESFHSLRGCSSDTLKAIGCLPWEEPTNGTVLMLFPSEWYPHIPAGFVVEDINGDMEAFRPGETDNDARYGMLPYGIRAGV